MLRCVRTTVTLDDDVAAEIERRRRVSGRGMKAEINRLLRAGLLADERQGPRPRRGRTPQLELGPSRVGPLDDVAGVLGRLDEP
jgi:plasmid stability protein